MIRNTQFPISLQTSGFLSCVITVNGGELRVDADCVCVCVCVIRETYVKVLGVDLRVLGKIVVLLRDANALCRVI